MDDSVWPQPAPLGAVPGPVRRRPRARRWRPSCGRCPKGAGRAGGHLDLVRALYRAGDLPGPTGDAWQDYVIHGVLCADNAFTRAAAAGTVSGPLRDAAAWDLMHLQRCFRLSRLRTRALLGGGVADEQLPTWAGRPEADGAGPFASPAFRSMAHRLARRRRGRNWWTIWRPSTAHRDSARWPAPGSWRGMAPPCCPWRSPTWWTWTTWPVWRSRRRPSGRTRRPSSRGASARICCSTGRGERGSRRWCAGWRCGTGKPDSAWWR